MYIATAIYIHGSLTAAAKAIAGRVQSKVGILTQQQMMARTIDSAK